ARPTINGTRPTINGTVNMNGSSTVVRGVDIVPPNTSPGLTSSGGGFTGLQVGVSATESDVTVSTTNATAVNLTGVSGTFSFISVSANSGTNGLAAIN